MKANNEAKLNNKDSEIILYIAEKLEEDPNYGATLLNKVLYFIDNINYLQNGETISNFKYVKQDHGPTPKPKEFLALRDHLIAKEDLIEEKVSFFGRVQKKYVSQRKADLEVFTPNEISLIDHVIDVFKENNLNATKVSNITHELLSFKLAESFEEIPFSAYMLTQGDPTEEDIAWANEEIDKYESMPGD